MILQKAHSESAFIPYVIRCLERNASVTFAELRNYIKEHFPLNQYDWALLPSLGCPVWHQRVRNLKSNKTLLRRYTNIDEVKNGFDLI
jgi:hypothetical protein